MPVLVGAPKRLDDDDALRQAVLSLLGERLDLATRAELAAALRTLAAALVPECRRPRRYAQPSSPPHLRVVPPQQPALPDEPVLTRREQDIAVRIAQGSSNRRIAHELVIALSTADRHVVNIFDKLGVQSRAQVAAWAVRRGLA